MVDYQEMYYKMNRAMEKAMRILIEAQRECEEEYLKQTDGLSIRQRGFIIDVKGKEGQHPVSLCFGGCGGIMTPKRHYTELPVVLPADAGTARHGKTDAEASLYQKAGRAPG